jgi:hypothetical protein
VGCSDPGRRTHTHKDATATHSDREREWVNERDTRGEEGGGEEEESVKRDCQRSAPVNDERVCTVPLKENEDISACRE